MMIVNFIVGLATGVISGMGIGGGSLLVLYLTAFAGIAQQEAGGINLLYFIGCAPAALIGHIRHKAVEWKAVLWCVVAGVLAAIPTALLTADMDTDLLRRLFGWLLIAVGLREWKAGKTPKTE